MKLGLFVFRRDLRLEDNTALNEALARCEQVIPCFIFNPQQLVDNPYRGEVTVQCMAEFLSELDAALREKGSRLRYFYGQPEIVIDELLASHPKIEGVFFNDDYTPFSRRRDEAISTVVARHRRTIISCADALLYRPGDVLKDDGAPYTVFTPFYKRAQRLPVRTPAQLSKGKFFDREAALSVKEASLDTLTYRNTPSRVVRDGRKAALSILDSFESLVRYKEERDFPSLGRTTKLSAHLKFGTISPREFYARAASLFGPTCHLIAELTWRDFFTHIAFHFPHVFSGAFVRRFDALAWSENTEAFDRWCQGMTGFPIVDAGMRELNETGYMHNRVRMIVASFLTKDLHLSWQWGERYFANRLSDYDPAVNNGSWQWAASTGCDAQPYFRVFNPWLQGAKFDTEARYIKRWIPELERLSPKEIHSLHEARPLFAGSYPEPIVDHHEEKDRAIERFRELK